MADEDPSGTRAAAADGKTAFATLQARLGIVEVEDGSRIWFG
jgi:hypothetical protein